MSKASISKGDRPSFASRSAFLLLITAPKSLLRNCWRRALVAFEKRRRKLRCANTHLWTRRDLGPYQSDFFIGNDLMRRCHCCKTVQRGWSQRGARWNEEGARVEMQRIHWNGGEIEVEDLTPNNNPLSKETIAKWPVPTAMTWLSDNPPL